MSLAHAPALSGPWRSAVRTEDGGLGRLEAAWRRSDALFGLLRLDALSSRPIALRQPLLFYVGHLPAFAWNHLGRRLRGLPSLHPRFEDVFARGIDPLDESGVPAAAEWPSPADVRAYRDAVRDA